MTAAALLLCLPLPAPEPRPCDLPDVDASDVCRFPPRRVLRARVLFAERHLEWLDARAKALGPDWADREYGYRTETERRLNLWRMALWALNAADTADTSLCAEHLARLRYGLGVRDYNAGRLPELPDPAWFSRAD
jgi:hypothetical protein